jgi:hypothetical protein
MDAISIPVQAKLRTRVGPRERFLVTRDVGATPEWKCRLSNADDSVPIETLVRVTAQRHRIEECFERAKGEAGLTHYEVRSWVGWHHHMTMSLLALWYLTRHQRRLLEKIPGMTVQRRAEMIEKMLLPVRRSARWVARDTAYVLRGNEEARYWHWKSRGLVAPPRPLTLVKSSRFNQSAGRRADARGP